MMLKPLMEKYDSFVITEKTDYSAEAKKAKNILYEAGQSPRKRFYLADDSKCLEVYRHL